MKPVKFLAIALLSSFQINVHGEEYAPGQDSFQLQEVQRQFVRDFKIKQKRQAELEAKRRQKKGAITNRPVTSKFDWPKEGVKVTELLPSSQVVPVEAGTSSGALANAAQPEADLLQEQAKLSKSKSDQRWVVIEVKCFGGEDMRILNTAKAPKVGEPFELNFETIESLGSNAVQHRVVRNHKSPLNAYVISTLKEGADTTEAACRPGQSMITSLELMEENPAYKRAIERIKRRAR